MAKLIINKQLLFYLSALSFHFFLKIKLQSWGFGLSTSAAYTRVFMVVCLIL